MRIFLFFKEENIKNRGIKWWKKWSSRWNKRV